MKVGQLSEILETVEKIYCDSGNASASQALKEVSSLFAGHESMMVSKFSSLIAKVTSIDKARE